VKHLDEIGKDLLARQMYPYNSTGPEKLAFGSGFEIAKNRPNAPVD
jgi:hypothetical protein